MPAMNEKRYLATAVLNEDGHMWVFGGTSNSKAAQSTEVFHYNPRNGQGRWQRANPLPADLRDSGLESHCSVRLNASHVFVAGGFARTYRPSDPTRNHDRDPVRQDSFDGLNPRRGRRQTDEPDDVIFGGIPLKRAWLYDGYYWAEIADMQFVRDRPACSTVTKADGSVSTYVISLICMYSLVKTRFKRHYLCKSIRPSVNHHPDLQQL